MDPVYVFGHKNPDTDSVVAAISYAALCNAMGDNNYIAARLGHLNDETNYLLDLFGFDAPMMLTTVRTQVSDIDFDRPPQLGISVPVSHAWELMRAMPHLSALPVNDENGKLYGMITAGNIAESDMESVSNPMVKDVPVYNLLAALEGQIINSYDDVFDNISGEVVIALPSSSGFNPIKPGCIVLCGEQPEVIEKSLQVGASCVIICESNVAERYRGVSSSTCLIACPIEVYKAARMIYQSIPVSRIAQTSELVYFHLTDYIDDVRDTMLQSRYRSYPVLDESERVVGTLGRFHLIRPKRKRVVLVDHNERAQSVNGLDQAEILGIIDHHRLADVQTGSPVFMRNEPVGSTVTIVATMYQEKGLMPSPKLAGLMAAAIISDTVAFQSPTCTPRDKRIAERLARTAGLDLNDLAKKVFSATSSVDKPAEELLHTDFKEFHIAGHSLGIAQVTCMDTDAFLPRIEELHASMEQMRSHEGYDMVLLMLTDILRIGTDLLFAGDSQIIKSAFNTDAVHQYHVFLPGVVSRKKQIIPSLSVLWG